MKRIPLQLIKDYGIVGLVYIAVLLVLHPLYYGEYRITASYLELKLIHLIVLYLVLFVGEWLGAYVLRRPFSYAGPFLARLAHFVVCAVFCALVMMWLIRCTMCVVSAVIVTLVMTFLSEIRHMQYSLDRLMCINRVLENEPDGESDEPSGKGEEVVVLKGAYRETLTVRPQDILYVESMGNYLDVVYLKDGKWHHHRLRSSLKDIENVLSPYSFIVHIHRAFLVNIHFVARVVGNAAGCKVELKDCDKVLPVSKSNVVPFKEKIKRWKG